MRDRAKRRQNFLFSLTITKLTGVRLAALSPLGLLSPKPASLIVTSGRFDENAAVTGKIIPSMAPSFVCKGIRSLTASVGVALWVIASILVVASGCHVPLVSRQSIGSEVSSSQRVNQPIIEQTASANPVLPELPAPVHQATGAQSDSIYPVSSLTHPETAAGSTFAATFLNTQTSHADSPLSDASAWQFDPLADAQTGSIDFNRMFERDRHSTIMERLWDDQKNFYSPESLTLLGGGLIIGAAMANSTIDDSIHRHFQGSVRGATSDDWFESLHASKELGNGMYTLPVFATAWVAGELFPNNELMETSGRWGERSIRGFVVGAPPLIIMQQLTGGSRPTETDESSEWHPMRDNNGISGHAFMGSLPFITAAKMTNNRGYKALFYAGSAIVPLSRVNDNAHYPSQVALGWWMAYLAASAIDATDDPNSRWRFYPISTGDGSGMMAEFRY